MIDPIVSIIIVNYNAGAYLQRCVETIAQQTLNSCEVIIVDNASEDNSVESIQKYEYVRIQRNDQNLGFATAQNQGLKLARGRYLMPLNFDIALAPTFLQEMVATIEKNGKVGSVACKLLRMKSNGEPTRQIDNVGLLLPRSRFPLHRGYPQTDYGQYDRPALVFGAIGAAALYRREMLADIAYQDQFFDESYFMWYEDIDLEWRARLRGWKCLYAPSAVAYHIGDVHGHGRSKFGAKVSMRNRWRMILSNECSACFVRNLPWLLAEEAALLRYVISHQLLGSYLYALKSFATSVPHVLKKRRWVRGRATTQCLPEYPIAYMEGI